MNDDNLFFIPFSNNLNIYPRYRAYVIYIVVHQHGQSTHEATVRRAAP